MSYLDIPRINFSGQFFTNVSTINNTPRNYDPGQPIDPGWNPTGTAHFAFRNCTVRSVQSSNGPAEGIVGAAVDTPGDPTVGKLVDLDPEQQMLSQVIGVKVRLVTTEGAGFEGRMALCNLQDIWRRSLTGQGKAGGNQASAVFISVLGNVTWTGLDQSGPLRELHDASENHTVPIRFILDSYFFGELADPNSGLGRIVGTFGPHKEKDPVQFVQRRLILPAFAGSARSPSHEDPLPDVAATEAIFQAANILLDKDRSALSLDLGNSIQMAQFSGDPVDVGQLRTVIIERDGGTNPVSEDFRFSSTTYLGQGGIVELNLTSEQTTRLGTDQAALQRRPNANSRWRTVLEEHTEGLYVNIDPFTYRLVAGTDDSVELAAFRWGQPLPGRQLVLQSRASPRSRCRQPSQHLCRLNTSH